MKRREAEAAQNSGGNGNRRAETGSAFEESAKRKSDEKGLQVPVGSELADGGFDGFKVAGFNGNPV